MSPYLVSSYQKAYRLKREHENENAWLAGLYVFNAVSVAVYNSFRDRGKKAEKYIERPIDIFPLTEKEKQKREMDEWNKIQRQLQAMQRAQKAQKQEQQSTEPHIESKAPET